MSLDSHYSQHRYQVSQVEHHYGENVHIVSDPYLFTTLAKLCQPECQQPLFNALLTMLYRELVRIVVNQEFPVIETLVETRMKALHPEEGQFQGLLLDTKTKVACVSLARAGILPSQICFDAFNYFLEPEGVRQDHISINRKTDAKDQVVGINLGGHKIGGDVEDRIVVIPDPMGATGSTIKNAIDLYRERGKPKKVVAMHLIVTPEYLKFVRQHYPETIVYALRLDRGLSSPRSLAAVPGKFWDEERGLNDKQYIVPGAGGLGEIINNSYV